MYPDKIRDTALEKVDKIKKQTTLIRFEKLTFGNQHFCNKYNNIQYLHKYQFL